MTKAHNDKMLALKIQELKERDIPGKTQADKVEWLMDNYPFLEAKNMVEILGGKPSSIHTARHKVKKKREAMQQPVKEVQKQHNPPQAENRINDTHKDIWDEVSPYDYENLEPPKNMWNRLCM